MPDKSSYQADTPGPQPVGMPADVLQHIVAGNRRALGLPPDPPPVPVDVLNTSMAYRAPLFDLPCGHPIGCQRGGEGKSADQVVTLWCGWCEAEGRAKAQAAILTDIRMMLEELPRSCPYNLSLNAQTWLRRAVEELKDRMDP
jgi:hypothetical protein